MDDEINTILDRLPPDCRGGWLMARAIGVVCGHTADDQFLQNGMIAAKVEQFMAEYGYRIVRAN